MGLEWKTGGVGCWEEPFRSGMLDLTYQRMPPSPAPKEQGDGWAWRSWPRQKVEGGNATACQEGRGQSGWLGPGSGGAVTWLGNCHGEYTNPIGHTATGPFIMLAYTRSPEQFPQKVKTAPPNVINLFSLCWKCDMKNIRRLKKEGPALEST